MASREVSDAGIYGYGTYGTTVFFPFSRTDYTRVFFVRIRKKKKVCKCIGIYVDEGRAESDACERFSSRTRASRARHAQGSRIGRENREDRSVR